MTRQLLEDVGANKIEFAYDYLAGITRENNWGGINGDDYLARGFETENILYNGNRTGQPTSLDTANVERVEALRGPTALLFGRADPGGLINIITKQPLAEPLYQVEVLGGSGLFDDGSRLRDVRATVDLGGPLDKEGRLRYRLNGAAEYDRSFRQDVEERLFFVSPVVEYQLSDATIVNVELSYQYREEPFDRGVPFINGKPRLDRDWYVGEDNPGTFDKHYLSGAFRLEHALNNDWTARLGVYTSYNDITGDIAHLGGIFDDGTAVAHYRRLATEDFFLTLQPELVGEFMTGWFGHTVLLGVDFAYQRNKFFGIAGGNGTPFNIFDPDFPVDTPPIDLTQPGAFLFDDDFTATSVGLYIQDQIDLTEQLKLLLGLRWDGVWIDDDLSGAFGVGAPEPFPLGGKDTLYDNNLIPRVGLVYQPIKQLGLYASYAETYRPPLNGGLGLVDREGNPIEAEEAQSYEIGIKLDALEGRLGGTLALFRANKRNVIESDPIDPFALINLGRVRSEGIEFDLSGEPMENLSFGFTYTYTDAHIPGNDSPLPQGTRLRNIPHHAASFQAAYSFTQGPLTGLRLFSGLVYEDIKLASTSATDKTKIPDYVRFDLGASYKLTKHITARLLARNVTDKEYYTSAAGPLAVAVGEPLNLEFGVKVQF